ncbi:MAG: glycine cleavage system aminomethyltransferase GcvT [Candidatus Lokiarchaeota archaeon]|nr:glycine cleavage system aminomethyltransferase GcvT [Candidatus Lokiarchaeota archaeon]
MVKRLPLHTTHVELGAKMIEFAGYIMPVHYETGVIAEHMNVRENIGLFDISHMGEVLVEGPDAKPYLQKMFTNDLSLLYDGKSQYGCLCYENGTTVEDSFYYQHSETKYRLIINAANREKDLNWLSKHAEKFNVRIKDMSNLRGRYALQGPKSFETLEPLLSDSIKNLQRFHFKETQLLGVEVFIAQTGYTGEFGYEISFEVADAQKVWNSILESGKIYNILPIGLGARDTLRLEACYSLYGHELTDKITPVEAGIGFCVKPKEGIDFIGKKVLLDQKENGTDKKIVGFEIIGKGIGREEYKVYSMDGEEIGYITSGTFSPLLKKAIGLVLLKIEYTSIGTEFNIDIRGKPTKAIVAPTPFYDVHKK